MTGTVLLCTVGGSHQPILTSIRQCKPEYVIFFCSGTDPGTGRPGSETQITGQGAVIKAVPSDAHATLPNIPTQLGLMGGEFDVHIVAADDLDACFLKMEACLRDLARRFPNHRCVADYTGGTKTMTAALVAAALEHPTVDLQVVTGNRANLVRVTDGTQYAAPAGVDSVRTHELIATRMDVWARFAYDEAALSLQGIAMPQSVELRAQVNRARDLSAAFAAWDRFHHTEALRLIENYTAVVGRSLSAHLPTLRTLTGESSVRREAAQIWDLWLNAQRRAAAGRHDDAVARLYRVLEWTVQWILRHRVGIDTSDVAADKMPADAVPGRKGKYQVGLFAAWQLLSQELPGTTAANFIDKERERLTHFLNTRNASILAHGFEPVDKAIWLAMHDWAQLCFVPMLCEEMRSVGLKQPCPQLPSLYLVET